MIPSILVSVPERRMPWPTGGVSSAVQVQRYPDHLNLTHNFSLSLKADLLDESIHGCSNCRKVLAQILPAAFRWHGLVIFARDVDDAEDMSRARVLGYAVDCWDELILAV